MLDVRHKEAQQCLLVPVPPRWSGRILVLLENKLVNYFSQQAKK